MTDNRAKKLVAAKKSPLDVHAVIYIPNKRARGNPSLTKACAPCESKIILEDFRAACNYGTIW